MGETLSGYTTVWSGLVEMPHVLHHVIISNDFHSSISKINSMYDVSDEDHIRFKVYINSNNISNSTAVLIMVEQK